MDLPTQIERRLSEVGVKPSEVVEKFIRGSGTGGQKINKTSSTVTLRHGPTGLEVRCQRGRYQAANREQAWLELCEKLEERQRLAVAGARAERELVRRRTRKKSRRQKAIMVEGKRHRAGIKSQRGRVQD